MPNRPIANRRKTVPSGKNRNSKFLSKFGIHTSTVLAWLQNCEIQLQDCFSGFLSAVKYLPAVVLTVATTQFQIQVRTRWLRQFPTLAHPFFLCNKFIHSLLSDICHQKLLLFQHRGHPFCSSKIYRLRRFHFPFLLQVSRECTPVSTFLRHCIL